MSYVEEVRRFGGPSPYEVEGRRANLSHQISFDAEEVITDGVGNIIRMPLLLRKPCFGRPERWFRALPDWRRQALLDASRTKELGLVVPGTTPCDRCPVADACAAVVSERLESAPLVDAALERWLTFADQLEGERRFARGAPKSAWEAVLAAIIDHGGWTNVNDLQVPAALQVREEERKIARRTAAKKARLKIRRRPINQQLPPFDLRLHSVIQAERDRRLAILMELKDYKDSPAYITRLDDAGCRRTADVWMGRTIIECHSGEARPQEIARWLAANSLNGRLMGQSLSTTVHRTLARIMKLEDEIDSHRIWKKFCPFCEAGIAQHPLSDKCYARTGTNYRKHRPAVINRVADSTIPYLSPTTGGEARGCEAASELFT